MTLKFGAEYTFKIYLGGNRIFGWLAVGPYTNSAQSSLSILTNSIVLYKWLSETYIAPVTVLLLNKLGKWAP